MAGPATEPLKLLEDVLRLVLMNGRRLEPPLSWQPEQGCRKIQLRGMAGNRVSP